MRIIGGRIPWATLTLVAIIFLGALAKESVRGVFSLGSDFIEKGQWWQVLTCHTVHFGWGHFWRDVPLLALLGWLMESKSRSTFLATLGIAAFGVPFAVLLCEPEILPYRGASGLAAAVFSWLAANMVIRRNAGWLFRLTGLVALVMLVAKIWLDLTGKRLLVADEGAIIVVVSWSSHLAGALVGLGVSLFQATTRGRARRSQLQQSVQ